MSNHVIGVVVDKLLAQDWDTAPPDVPVRHSDTRDLESSNRYRLQEEPPINLTRHSLRQDPQTLWGGYWNAAGGKHHGGRAGEVPEAVDEDVDCDETVVTFFAML